MFCPVCSEKMKEVQKQGVDIDICPGCKGVWLDRGELEKLITMEANYNTEPSSKSDPRERLEDRKKDIEPERMRDSRDYDDDDDRKRDRDREGYDDRRYRDDSRDPKRRKKGNFLGDIFDMFGGGD